MRSITLAAVLALLAACGTEGPTGPAGPPGPDVDRTKLYCDTVSTDGLQDNNTWTRVALCRTTADIPFSGDCYLGASPGVSQFFYVSNSAPVAWTQTGSRAGWTCTWSPTPGAPSPLLPANFPGVAEICCLSKP